MLLSSDCLETGNILLCHTKDSVEASLLRWGLASYWNHAVIVVRLGKEVWVVEAKGGSKVKAILYDTWITSLRRDILVIPTRVSRDKIVKWVGREYDYGSIFPLFYYRLTGSWIGRRHIHNKKLYCFELIGIILELDEPWKTLPEDLQRLT